MWLTTKISRTISRPLPTKSETTFISKESTTTDIDDNRSQRNRGLAVYLFSNLLYVTVFVTCRSLSLIEHLLTDFYSTSRSTACNDTENFVLVGELSINVMLRLATNCCLVRAVKARYGAQISEHPVCNRAVSTEIGVRSASGAR